MELVKQVAKYFTLSVAVVYSTCTFSQTDKIDSLKIKLKGSDDKKQQILIYNKLVDEYWHISPQTAISYSDTAYTLASTIDYPLGLMHSLSNKGVAFYTIGDYDSAEIYYKRALSLEEKLGVKTNTFIFYLNLIKQKGDYRLLNKAIRKELENKPISEVDKGLLRAVLDVYIITGDLKKSKSTIDELVSRPEYKNDHVFRSKSNRIISKYLNLAGDYDSASRLLTESMDYYRSISDSLTIGESKLRLGNIYMIQGMLKKAQEEYQNALSIYESAEYEYGIASAKYELGRLYSELGEYSTASQLFFDALEVFEGQNNLNEIADTYIELGWINNYQNLPDRVLEYINKAIAISDSVKNIGILGKAYNMLGIYYDTQKKYDKALQAYDKSLAFMEELEDKKGVAAVRYNIGYIEEERGNLERAEKLYLDAYQSEIEIGNSLGMAISESSLGSLYTKTGELDKAMRYLDLAREKLQIINSHSNLLDNYSYTVKLMEKKGDFAKANVYYNKIIELNEEITNDKISNTLAELEVKYDLRNKEREIEFLNLENTNRSQELALKEQVIKNQRFFIITVLLAAILLLSLVVAGYRLLRFRNQANKELEKLNRKVQEKNEEITSQSEELKEANTKITFMNENLEQKIDNATKDLQKAYEELDTFFYRSSHDFRGPLTTFLGLTKVADKMVTDPVALNIFKKVEETALQLDKMVNKLKAISLISDDSLEKDTVNLNNLTDDILDNKASEIEKRKVNLEKDYKEYIEVEGNFEIIRIIVENIVENALLYNSGSDPKLSIEIRKENGIAELIVTDNGDGIPEKYQSLVFDMYFRCNEYSTGNGLGLYLVKKAVDNIKGSIEINSQLKKGTSVKVSFPQV